MPIARIVCGTFALLVLAGCAGLPRGAAIGGPIPPATALPREGIAEPDGVAYATRAGSAAVPLAPWLPNWRIEVQAISADQFQIGLRMLAVHAGGDGEARWLFHRQAAQLAAGLGYAGYQVVSYSEGIESGLPLLAQRIGGGVVRLLPQPR